MSQDTVQEGNGSSSFSVWFLLRRRGRGGWGMGGVTVRISYWRERGGAGALRSRTTVLLVWEGGRGGLDYQRSLCGCLYSLVHRTSHGVRSRLARFYRRRAWCSMSRRPVWCLLLAPFPWDRFCGKRVRPAVLSFSPDSTSEIAFILSFLWAQVHLQAALLL